MWWRCAWTGERFLLKEAVASPTPVVFLGIAVFSEETGNASF